MDEWFDEKKWIEDEIKRCVDYAFSNTEGEPELNKLLGLAMKKSKGHCSPKMMEMEIIIRLTNMG
jgi:hypothetical protein